MICPAVGVQLARPAGNRFPLQLLFLSQQQLAAYAVQFGFVEALAGFIRQAKGLGIP